MKKSFVDVRITAAIDLAELPALLDRERLLGAWEEESAMHLYWAAEEWHAEMPARIRLALEQLGAGGEASIEVCALPDQDWNAGWAASILPVRVGRRFVIRQSWNPVDLRDSEIGLIIDPGRAFGTGYHETTQMLLEWLEEKITGGEQVLDLGTGSGILAMAAIRLGAARAVGLDNDPEAIECALEYAAWNEMGGELELRVAALDGAGSGEYDLVLANLDRRTLLAETDALARNTRRGGRVLISGLQAEDETEMSAALRAVGLEPSGRKLRGEWLSMAARFPPAK